MKGRGRPAVQSHFGYVRTEDAARYLGIGKSTLERKRRDGSGPRFRVLGARIVTYAIADLDAWADGFPGEPK